VSLETDRAALDAQVRGLRSSAGASRAGHVAVIRVDGADAFDLLEHASTRRLYLREGQVRHTLLLREDAGVFADVYIGSADDGLYVLAEGPTEGELVAWLEDLRSRPFPSSRVEVCPLSEERVTLGVDGPYAWEVVSGLLGRAVLGMPYLTLLRRDDVLCLRAGKTGEYGYLLVAPRSPAGELEARLAEVGAPLGLVTVGREALDVCALENGHFSMRTLRETALAQPLTPIELQLQWRVAYDRAFAGSEALRARRAEGPRVRATSFTADGALAPGQTVRLGDEDVGEVLAASPSPTLGAWVGTALLARRLAHPHVALAATTAAGPVQVTTRTPPLVDNLSLHVDPHKHSYATRDAGAASPRLEPVP
jgi:glycine cleavage system aminomethyltransferase T